MKKKITTAFLVSSLLMIAAVSCKKSQDATPITNAEETSNSTLAINDSATLREGVCALVHGLSSVQGNNYNNFPSFQATVWTYLGTAAPRRSLMKFSFTNLNPACTEATLISAKLYLYQFDEINNTGNYYSIRQEINDAEVRRIKIAWNPATVTWLNQPTTYGGLPTAARNAVSISPIATPFAGSQDNQVLDVTQMVKKMLAGGAPYINNNGFEIRFPHGRETQAYKGRTYGSFGTTLASAKPVLKLYWQ